MYMTYLELFFVCGIRHVSRYIFSTYLCSCYSTFNWKDFLSPLHCLSTFAKNPLTIDLWICVWALLFLLLCQCLTTLISVVLQYSYLWGIGVPRSTIDTKLHGCSNPLHKMIYLHINLSTFSYIFKSSLDYLQYNVM